MLSTTGVNWLKIGVQVAQKEKLIAFGERLQLGQELGSLAQQLVSLLVTMVLTPVQRPGVLLANDYIYARIAFQSYMHEAARQDLPMLYLCSSVKSLVYQEQKASLGYASTTMNAVKPFSGIF